MPFSHDRAPHDPRRVTAGCVLLAARVDLRTTTVCYMVDTVHCVHALSNAYMAPFILQATRNTRCCGSLQPSASIAAAMRLTAQ